MKIKSLLIGMLACSAMVACTNTDEPEVDNGGAKGNESYLAVKLVNPSAGSRATGNYAYGSEAEQTVTSARFYLFDAAGNAYEINDGSNPTNNGKNYVDATPSGTFTESGSDNVETVLSTVLVIDSSKKLPPASILAVLNCSDLLDTDNLSLSQLKIKVANFGTIKDEKSPAPYIGKGKFAMSNSVFVDAAGNLAEATPIAAENIKTKKEDALKPEAAVEIYVERVAAKVQTEVSIPTTVTEETKKEGKFFKIGDEFYANTGEVDANGKDIYAHLLGWRVTNITNQSKLIKDLDGTANANPALAWTWNNPANFRSYWADANYDPAFVWTFNEATLPFTGNNFEYYNENTKNITGNHKESKNSQLLVAAEFVTIDGGVPSAPQAIAEWYGVKYTLNGLRKVVADALASKLYTTTDNKTYVSIKPEEITFTQVSEELDDNRYISKIGVKDQTYYYKNDEKMAAYDVEGNKTLASVVDALQTTKIWGNEIKDGETTTYEGGGYYYLDIIHNAGTITKDKEGKITSDTNVYGLVRNHWYKLTLNKLSGLGTPVYNPDKVIITETPETDASFIAAEINVLAWRMVEQGVDLK